MNVLEIDDELAAESSRQQPTHHTQERRIRFGDHDVRSTAEQTGKRRRKGETGQIAHSTQPQSFVELRVPDSADGNAMNQLTSVSLIRCAGRIRIRLSGDY
jgi:hypothetical protein